MKKQDLLVVVLAALLEDAGWEEERVGEDIFVPGALDFMRQRIVPYALSLKMTLDRTLVYIANFVPTKNEEIPDCAFNELRRIWDEIPEKKLERLCLLVDEAAD